MEHNDSKENCERVKKIIDITYFRRYKTGIESLLMLGGYIRRYDIFFGGLGLWGDVWSNKTQYTNLSKAFVNKARIRS